MIAGGRGQRMEGLKSMVSDRDQAVRGFPERGSGPRGEDT